jgi:hypothetical protein
MVLVVRGLLFIFKEVPPLLGEMELPVRIGSPEVTLIQEVTFPRVWEVVEFILVLP